MSNPEIHQYRNAHGELVPVSILEDWGDEVLVVPVETAGDAHEAGAFAFVTEKTMLSNPRPWKTRR